MANIAGDESPASTSYTQSVAIEAAVGNITIPIMHATPPRLNIPMTLLYTRFGVSPERTHQQCAHRVQEVCPRRCPRHRFDRESSGPDEIEWQPGKNEIETIISRE